MHSYVANADVWVKDAQHLCIVVRAKLEGLLVNIYRLIEFLFLEQLIGLILQLHASFWVFQAFFRFFLFLYIRYLLLFFCLLIHFLRVFKLLSCLRLKLELILFFINLTITHNILILNSLLLRKALLDFSPNLVHNSLSIHLSHNVLSRIPLICTFYNTRLSE